MPLVQPLQNHQYSKKSVFTHLFSYISLFLGAFIAAFAIDIFFLPNNLIDGGTVGLSMIAGRVFGNKLIPCFLIIFNIPFVYFAYRHIGKTFVIHLVLAIIAFSLSLAIIPFIFNQPFIGDNLEVVVVGGAILGVGAGLIIRGGGCTDGTEILGIIINRRHGFTVGQVVLCCNVIVFTICGLVFQDWHPPLLSLITYIVVVKVMDAVIVGLDETKSVLVISQNSKEIAKAVLHDLRLGLTIMYGRGGFSGKSIEILYIIAERLQLAELKDLIYKIDPTAFIAIENLHEVSTGKQNRRLYTGKKHIVDVAQKTLQV
jgi:uncharacterized membrane-anchored protein YitT (DUF2179 family)